MTIKIIFERLSGKSKAGLSKGGLGPKGANLGQKGPFRGNFCSSPESAGKTAFWKVAFLLSSLFPRKYSDNNFGLLPPFHPPGGRTRGP